MANGTSPLLSLAISTGSPEMKDNDKEKGKHKRLDANKMVPDKPKNVNKKPTAVEPNNHPLAANTWKPPTHKERLKMAGEDGHVESTRRWVRGDISTKEHKENMKRAKIAMGYKD